MQRYFITLLSILFFTFSNVAFAAEKQGSNSPTYMVTGDAELFSQYVDRGLAITDQNPGLNASFLFNLGQQFKFGFWGSNISNVTAQNDNLWLKVIASIHIDINATSKMDIYINDDHFYKSDLRNGQEVGFNLDYSIYFFQFEYMNNFQGSKTGAQYIKGGKYYFPTKDITLAPSAGYTIQQAAGYSNYLDVKGAASYQVSQTLSFDGAITTTLAGSGYGSRGNSAITLGIKLKY